MVSLIPCQARTSAEDLHSSLGTQHHAPRERGYKRGFWGLWNIGSMVDTVGSLAIASRRQNGQLVKLVNLVVRELKRYNVKVAGLQETKCFGCDVYDVAGSVVLTAGRPLPDAAIASREMKE